MYNLFTFVTISGYLSNPGATFCKQCPAGYACPNTADFSANTQCTLGSYSTAGTMTCTDCVAGNYCPNIE